MSFLLLIPAALAAWPQYGADPAHTSAASSRDAIDAHDAPALTLRWAADVGSSAASAPVVGNHVVFATAGGKILAFDERDGTPLWGHLTCGGEGAVEPALASPDIVVVGDPGGDLAAYAVVDGTQLWCDDEGGSITAAPAVAGDGVVFTNGFEVAAVDVHTGVRRWSFSPGGEIAGSPAVAGGVVYVAGGTSVAAIDARTGHALWETDLGDYEANLSAPVVGGGLVYVGGTTLYALHAADGSPAWEAADIGVNVTAPALYRSLVIAGSQDAAFGLHAFDAADGSEIWVNRAGGESVATPSVAGELVFQPGEMGELLVYAARNGQSLAALADPGGAPFASWFGAQAAVSEAMVFASTDNPGGPNRIDAFARP